MPYCRRSCLFDVAADIELTFANAVHQLDAGNDDGGIAEGFVALRFFGDCRIQLVDKNGQENTTYCGQLFEILLNATEPKYVSPVNTCQ